MNVYSSIFIIAKKWERSKCSLTDEWINIIQYIHRVKYYIVIKSNEVLIYDEVFPESIQPCNRDIYGRYKIQEMYVEQ